MSLLAMKTEKNDYFLGNIATKLSDHDKEIIRLIDLQVKLLLDKRTPEHLIINTLFEFIPDAQCMINSICEKQLDLYCKEYRYFNFFLQLILRLNLA